MTRSLAIIFKIGKVRAFGYAFGKHVALQGAEAERYFICFLSFHIGIFIKRSLWVAKTGSLSASGNVDGFNATLLAGFFFCGKVAGGGMEMKSLRMLGRCPFGCVIGTLVLHVSRMEGWEPCQSTIAQRFGGLWTVHWGLYATSYSTAARHKQRMKERSANVTAFVQDPWLHANDLSNGNSMQNCQGSIISARRRVTSFFPGKQLSSSQQASKFYQIFALLCGLWTVDYSL